MKLLLIISGSIAVKKITKILKILQNKKIYLDCIVTDSGKQLINLDILKKSINGKVYLNSSIKKNRIIQLKKMIKIDVAKNIVNQIINNFENIKLKEV